jgi:acyl carrier protein phosphodiesterase
MYPEDRVLIGVINRKRDLNALLNEQWYRIPFQRMPEGVNAEYLGFYISGILGKGKSGIYYYAPLCGIELLKRADLLPDEAQHVRANEWYFKCQMRSVKECHPPILNPSKQWISFIHTTWDRFADALTVSDLYSKSAFYVNRIYYALPPRNAF